MGIVRKIIFVIALVVFLGSAGYLGYYFWNAYQTDKAFEELKTEKPKGGSEHDLVRLHKKNSDTVGWVKVKGTRIDYPVMQTPDEPEYYLRRDFKKKYSIAGTPFMDAASKMDESSNYLIYGHNMKAGTMFHDLLKYEDKKFWKKHQYFTFDKYADGKQLNGKYRIVAFFRSNIKPEDSKGFKYYEYPYIADGKTYEKYVEGIKSIAEYDSGITPKWPQQLVTLSTCAYHTEDGRFAVVGVRVE